MMIPLSLPPGIAPIKSFHGENIVYVCDCKMDVIFPPFALALNLVLLHSISNSKQI